MLQGRTNACWRQWAFWPSTSTTPENIASVCEAILADRRQTIHDVCEIVGLSYGTVQRISARFVPRLLSDNQKALHISVGRELKQQAKDDPQLHLQYHNCRWNMSVWLWPWDYAAAVAVELAKFTVAKKNRVKFAAMSSPCWSFLPTSKALSTSNSYPLVKPSMASFTVRFWSGWGRAFGANVQTSGRKQLVSPPWQHACSHITLCLTIPDFQKHYSDSPPHSPVLAPETFSYFPKVKLRPKGCHFDKTQEIHAEMQEIIATLTYENFQGCMKSWETRWDCCIHAQVDYFKRDGGN